MHQNHISLHREKILNGLSSNLKTFSSSIWVFSFKKKFRSHARAFELGHIPFKICFPIYICGRIWNYVWYFSSCRIWKIRIISFIANKFSEFEPECSSIFIASIPSTVKKIKFEKRKNSIKPSFSQALLCWYLFKIVTEFTLKYKTFFTVHSNPCHSKLNPKKVQFENCLCLPQFDIQNHVTTLIQTIFMALIPNF